MFPPSDNRIKTNKILLLYKLSLSLLVLLFLPKAPAALAQTAFIDKVDTCAVRFNYCGVSTNPKDQPAAVKPPNDENYRISMNRCRAEMEKVCNTVEMLSRQGPCAPAEPLYYESKRTCVNVDCGGNPNCVGGWQCSDTPTPVYGPGCEPKGTTKRDIKLADGTICPVLFDNTKQDCNEKVSFPVANSFIHMSKDPNAKFFTMKPTQLEYSYNPALYVFRNGTWTALSKLDNKVYSGENIKVDMEITAEWLPPAGYYTATPQAYIRESFSWDGIDGVCNAKDATIFTLQDRPTSYHIMNFNTPVVMVRPSAVIQIAGGNCSGSSCSAPTQLGTYTALVGVNATQARQRFSALTDQDPKVPCQGSSKFTPQIDGGQDSIYKIIGNNTVNTLYDFSGPVEAYGVLPAWVSPTPISFTVVASGDGNAGVVNNKPQAEINFLNANPNYAIGVGKELEVRGKVLDKDTYSQIKKVRWTCRNAAGDTRDCQIKGPDGWLEGELGENILSNNAYISLVGARFMKEGSYTLIFEAWDENSLSGSFSVNLNISGTPGTESGANLSLINSASAKYCEIHLLSGKREETVCSSNEAVKYRALSTGLKAPLTYNWQCQEGSAGTVASDSDIQSCTYTEIGKSYVPSLEIKDSTGEVVKCNPVLFRVNRVEEGKKKCWVEMRKKGVLTGAYSSRIFVKMGDEIEVRVNGTCTEGKIFWEVSGGSPNTPKDREPVIRMNQLGTGVIKAGIGDLGEFKCTDGTIEVYTPTQWGL